MIDIVLPPALKHMVTDLVELGAKCMPSDALISQYRVLLDGAFMLASRILNEELRRETTPSSAGRGWRS